MRTKAVTLLVLCSALTTEQGFGMAQFDNLLLYLVVYLTILLRAVDVLEDGYGFPLVAGLEVAVVLLRQVARLKVELQLLDG